jgi:DNA (cytosine-5)-methyltransferase 1
MINITDFKQWLKIHTEYSDAVISDMASRLKRADKILPWFYDDVYQYKLEQTEEYKKISVSVRSQIKKSVTLYFKFVTDKKEQ